MERIIAKVLLDSMQMGALKCCWMHAHAAVLGGAIEVNSAPGTAQRANLLTTFWRAHADRFLDSLPLPSYNPNHSGGVRGL